MVTPKQARVEAGLSKRAMAKILNISEPTYAKKESGQSGFLVDEAYVFAEVCRLRFEDILFSSKHRPQYEGLKE